MEPEFRFCLNGEVIRSIRVQHEISDGMSIGKRQIAVEIEGIGWFTIDDNENLWDKDVRRAIRGSSTCRSALRVGQGRVFRFRGRQSGNRRA